MLAADVTGEARLWTNTEWMLKLQFGLASKTTRASFSENRCFLFFFCFVFQRPTFQTLVSAAWKQLFEEQVWEKNAKLLFGDFYIKLAFYTLLNQHVTLTSTKPTSTQSACLKLNTVNVVIRLIRGRATTRARGLMNLHSITTESDRLLSRKNELSFLYLWDHSPSINCSLSRLFITGKSG